MAPAFSKEAVLMGSIDNLCLACERYLRTEQDLCEHVSTAEHRANLDKTQYVAKHIEDRIRKIKKWYICEFCNILLSTITKVRLHVEEARHKTNVQLIERVGDVIVHGSTTIQEEAWHGLIDNNTCILCNIEFDDKDNHRRESKHIINLIQSKVNNDFNNVYRKVDDFTFHCLTCNKVMANIIGHFEDKTHKNLLQKCNDVKHSEPKVEYKNETIVEKDSGPSVIKNAEDIVGGKNHPETPGSCKSSNDLVEETLVKEDCIQESNESSAKAMNEETPNNDNINNIIQETAEKSGLTYISTGNKVYCKTCYKNVPSSLKNITEHINGELHKHNSRLSGKTQSLKDNDTSKKNTAKKYNFQRVSGSQFVRRLTMIKNSFGDDVVLNEKYCINLLSFTFLRGINPGQIRCHVCEENIAVKEIKNHVSTERHNKAVSEIPVIIHADSEFIREVRSGSFHCGFCNIIDSWEGIEEHLKTTQHKEAKTFASWRLHEYLPAIEHNQHVERLIHNEYLTRLLFS